MKKIYLFLFLLAVFFPVANIEAQLLKDAKKLLNSKSSGGLTESDAVAGIKEALIKGTGESVKLVSNLDGYFGNPEIKIPFPEDAKVMESKLRAVGMGNKVDEVVLTINRAAEDAAQEAKSIFVEAIKKMTVTDAINIVKGDKNAATLYLKRTTSPELNKKFQPIIKASLDKVSATKYWKDIVSTYNKIPLVTKMNPNLTEYVTGKAIDGLFIMIAKEEEKIRKDPAARTSEILKKVFGK